MFKLELDIGESLSMPGWKYSSGDILTATDHIHIQFAVVLAISPRALNRTSREPGFSDSYLVYNPKTHEMYCINRAVLDSDIYKLLVKSDQDTAEDMVEFLSLFNGCLPVRFRVGDILEQLKEVN